ncbi:hypothetical protein [Cupriavidus basilensis]|uniref:hypothetical protein n=1 Tax=Cupriavidus basilensis TaxID=68895 RepID=UPI00157B7FA1|nr:hypothetical protein [Cupriavidus basilensis]
MQTLKIAPLYLKTTPQALRKIGMQVGDFVAFDANPEILDNGLIVQSGPTLPEDRQRRIGSVASFSHQLDPGQLARSETPLPHAGEPAHRRRDDDAS